MESLTFVYTMRRQILMLLDGPIIPVYALRLTEQLCTEIDCSVSYQFYPKQHESATSYPRHWKPDLLEDSKKIVSPQGESTNPAPDLVIDFRSSPELDNAKCPIIRCDFFEHACNWEFPALAHCIVESRGYIQLKLTLLIPGSREETVIDTAQVPVSLHHYRRSLNRIIAEVLRLISRSTKLVLTDAVQAIAANEKKDSTRIQVGRFQLRWSILQHRLTHRYRKFTSNDVWNIAKVDLPIERLAFGKSDCSEKTQWMKESANGSFQADPFAFRTSDQKDRLLYEYFKNGSGSIFIYPENRSLLDGSHFSYPYTLEFEGEHYVLPENHCSGQLVLYKLNSKLSGIEQSFVLLDRFHAVDPSLVFFEQRWWLFCTDATDKGADIRLHIFHSESLTGPFVPHLKNPVKTDICSARPAGHLFIHEGKLYRPAQDSSTSYGGCIRIHRIETITTRDFSEVCINTLEPNQFGTVYSAGIHTLSVCGNHCYIDGKRTRRGLFFPFKPTGR